MEINGDGTTSSAPLTLAALASMLSPHKARKIARNYTSHGAHCGEGPVLAMLAVLRVALLLPSPTLRAVAR
jgi:hypothetical protein